MVELAPEYDVDLLISGAGHRACSRPITRASAPAVAIACRWPSPVSDHRLAVTVVDALPQPGVAGFPAIRGRDPVTAPVDQVAQATSLCLLDRQARDLTEAGDKLVVSLADGSSVQTGAILIAVGIGEFRPRSLPAGDGWLDRGMVHFVPSLAVHEGQQVVVVDGGDSGVDRVLA